LGCGHGYWVQKVVGSSLNGVLGMLEHYTTDFFFLKQAITFLCLWINLGVDVCICIVVCCAITTCTTFISSFCYSSLSSALAEWWHINRSLVLHFLFGLYLLPFVERCVRLDIGIGITMLMELYVSQLKHSNY
jgi:hypothetical protein